MVSLILLRIETICHGDGLISVNEDNEIYSLIIWFGSLNVRKTLAQASLRWLAQSSLKKGSFWDVPGAVDLKDTLLKKVVWETRIQN